MGPTAGSGMAQPKDIPDEYVELTGEILALRTKMEIVRQENEALKDKIQVQLQANDKQRSALAEQIDANVRATKELAIEEQTQSDLDKKLAVKEGILLKIKTDKCDLANDRNREKKHLMNTMNMGLNVLELGDEMAEIEFVIGDHQILTTFNCKEEKFTRK